MLRILTILLVFSPICSIGQVQYSNEEKTAFVEVYFIEKEVHQEMIESLDSLLSSSGLTPEVYQNYYKAIQNGEGIPGEIELLMDSQKEIETLWEKNKRTIVEAACAERDLNYSYYIEIRNKYKREISFNREMQPYFIHYFENISDE